MRELSLKSLDAAANAVPAIKFEIKLVIDFKNLNYHFRANENLWFEVSGVENANEEVPQIKLKDGNIKLKLKLKHFRVDSGEEFHSEESEDTVLEESDKEEQAQDYIDGID